MLIISPRLILIDDSDCKDRKFKSPVMVGTLEDFKRGVPFPLSVLLSRARVAVDSTVSSEAQNFRK